MKTVILCGGKGTRISEETSIIPKPMVKIGKKPILKPSQKHSYKSNCFLVSPIGAMKGFYKMVNFTTSKSFKVYIPTFQLMAPSILN